MRLSGSQVLELARDIVLRHPEGIRYQAVVNEIRQLHAETPHGTITGNVQNVAQKYPLEVSKVDRGLYAPLTTALTLTTAQPSAAAGSSSTRPAQIPESKYYAPFADYLRNELEECTHARPLGGALGGKWGTPDVVGINRPTAADLIKFQVEIIAAEIKVDIGQSVVAFGQAASYRLFSNKSYMVVPETMSKDEQSQLTARCALFGIGLVFFELDPEHCEFRLVVRAQGHTPDMYYANQFAERIKSFDATLFSELFG